MKWKCSVVGFYTKHLKGSPEGQTEKKKKKRFRVVELGFFFFFTLMNVCYDDYTMGFLA